MRITGSSVSLASSQINISTHSRYEYLKTWDTKTERTSTKNHTEDSSGEKNVSTKDIIDISPEAAASAANGLSMKTATAPGSFNISDEEFIGDLKARIIKGIVEMMTGKKIDVLDPADIEQNAAASSTNDVTNGAAAATAMQNSGWGVDYYFRESTYTKEGISFSAKGAVTTADGQSISFSTSLEMSRETFQQVELSIKGGDALIDPLIIDLAQGGARFSDVKFEFDLDSDGTNEFINTPGAGTGFLAIDSNGNGIIDNGTELFGPQTGSGFSELAALDSDGNGWIDENDKSFDKLRIWQKNDDGTDSIASLLKNNVGAIYTGKTTTQYSIADSGNNLAAMLRETGLYLRENGGSGVVQEVDVAV